MNAPRYTPLQIATILSDHIYATLSLSLDGMSIPDVQDRLVTASRLANDVVKAIDPETVFHVVAPR